MIINSILNLVVVGADGLIAFELPLDACQMHGSLPLRILDHHVDIIREEEIHHGDVMVCNRVMQGRVTCPRLLVLNRGHSLIVIKVGINTPGDLFIPTLLGVHEHVLIASELGLPPFVPYALIRSYYLLCAPGSRSQLSWLQVRILQCRRL